MEKKPSPLVSTEDWWAVWLGLGIILIALIFYAAGTTIKPLAVSPPKWQLLSGDAVVSLSAENWSPDFSIPQESAYASLNQRFSFNPADRTVSYLGKMQDSDRNALLELIAGSELPQDIQQRMTSVVNNLANSSVGPILPHFAGRWLWYILLFIVFLCIFLMSMKVMGRDWKIFIPGFSIIFVVSLLILVLSSWKYAKDYNFEAPLVALLIGLIVGNIRQMPEWFRTALLTEYYIKTGIVLLGATLPLTLIFRAGPIAFVQATIVSLITFGTIYYAGTRFFGLDNQLSAVLGAAGSICGVSAAIAVGGAVQAKKEQIAMGISIVTIWAIVMIFILPFACRGLGLPLGVGGAWIGTSEFADAAGFAAAAALSSESEAAINAYTLMKVIGRDIWIGIWAFVLSIVSVTIWERKSGNAQRVRAGIIWERFPKFVLGFIAASILMSFVTLEVSTENFESLIKGPIKTLRTWTFVFTFLCIGLTTRFKDLSKFGWEPFWAFTIGVCVNVPVGYILSTMVFVGYWASLG
ncbi:YeiH family protein [candidate division KSB1 bacterium]